MKASRLYVAVVLCLLGSVIITTAGSMRTELEPAPSTLNSPPVAGDDSYTKHGGGIIGPLLANDFDPDGDPMTIQIMTFPAHGSLSGLNGNSFIYQLSVPSYLGSDSFTYRACAAGVCSNVATVTITFINQAPVGGNDSYQVHGTANIGPMLANDLDPDGDPISFVLVTGASNGTVSGLPFPTFPNDVKRYVSNFGFIGTDTFTYKVCDSLQLCSSPITVTLNVFNNAPTPEADEYYVPPDGIIGPLMINDSDPDGDGFNAPIIAVGAAHGTVFGTANPDFKRYVPNAGFSGVDSFQYQITDFLGASGRATVTLNVPESDDAENNGFTSCNASIGRPVNLTNGNVYLQQTDYTLPGVGPQLNIARTYNSKQQSAGIFGRGWSTTYDQSIKVYDTTFIRLRLHDGRAVYFTRQNSSDNFVPVQKDFHGLMVRKPDGSFALTLPDGGVRRFSPAGQLVSLIDRNNNQTSLAYDPGGRILSATDSAGRTLSFTTNANGQVLTISDTMGSVATYNYGSGSQLLSVTYADNSGYQFGYDGGIRLTSVTDVLGNLIEAHTYDSQGRGLTSVQHGGVELYTFNYVSPTQTIVTDGLGRTSRFTIDKSKGRNVVTRVEGFCSCGGSQIQSWTYDDQSNVTSHTDALNHSTAFTYDAGGNRLTETDPTGTVSYTYNQFGDVLTRTDQLNGVITNAYDSAGNLLTVRDALNNPTTFSYDGRGQLLSITNARGNVTSFTYDALGNLTQQRNANNIITFYFYDARGRITKIRDGLSRSTLYAYDAVGRLSRLTHPDLSFVSFAYDLAGRRTSVTDERGNPSHYAYDNAYRLTTITDPLGHATSYTYDVMSNLTSMTDALGRVTTFEYDDFDRLKKTLYPPAVSGGPRLFDTVTYDAGSNVTQSTDSAGRVTSYTYDNVNRMASITDASNQTTTFQYDTLSRTTAIIDALNQHYQFGYDAAGRQTSATRAGVSMSIQHDAVGNATRRTDYSGTVTNYSYDKLNRLTTIGYPTRTATYAYDPLNNLTRATNENGSVYIGYDNRYRVSSFSDPFYYGISYNYDAAGNRTKLKLNGATYASYTYDAVNRLTNLSDSANQNFLHSYDAVNRLTARSAPNGVTSTYAYDGLNRLTALNHSRGTNLLIGNQYAYNDANNISSWTNGSGSHGYGYDPVDRLTSATNISQPNENYSYDSVGNRTSSHISASYGYQPLNKLTSTASGTYTYDTNGNLVARSDASGTTTFNWNEENQLIQVALPNGVTVSYKYDALGRRIQRTNNMGASERYVYDGQNVLIDLNADWSVANKYLDGPGLDNHLRQTNSATGAAYFLTDHLGSTAGLTDTSGNMLEQLTYDSFGNSPGSARTRYGYTGRERDPDTGLLYYRARFYDPQLGRFISEDPAGMTDGPNLYAYVGNNATNTIDPQGLFGSRGRWKIHQQIIRAALSRVRISASDLRILIREQKIFDQNTQGEQFAHVHAMTQPGERPQDARRKANQFVRFNICMARRLASQGKRPAAMVYLSHAMHTLQDAASPAHANFAVAWSNTLAQTLNHAPHYAAEIFHPGSGSVAHESTVNAWKYFTGELGMPADFFPNMFDREDGSRGYFERWSAPDHTSCDCY